MAINHWFEHVIDSYLAAVAEGRDWREAVAAAEAALGNAPRRLLTHKGLRQKGLDYSRQHIGRKVQDGTFPPPFKLSDAIPADLQTETRLIPARR